MGLIANTATRRRNMLILVIGAALAFTTAASGARLLTSQAAQASSLAAGRAVSGEAPIPDQVERAASSTVALATDTPTPVKNIVFILADDLDSATFEQVARLRALHAQGLTLNSMVTTESLCCPSRTSILRSQYVHNHRVVSNLIESGGGWATFAKLGEEGDCLPVWLHAAGIQTAYLGKYLNGYGEDGDPTAVPAGWDRWFVPTTKSGMYRGYGYTVNTDGRLKSYAAGKEDFLPDVLADQAAAFISTAHSPFYLQINSTAPHDPAPVAKRHETSNPSARIPRTASFNKRGAAAPSWRGGRKRINQKRVTRYDAYWQQRVRSSESIADTVDSVITALRQAGTLESTLIVVSSDNGFHAVSRRLPPGKRTPYFEDTIVPTILIGPGIVPGTQTSAMTSTIDLAPTFAELLGATVPDWADGRSLVPLLAGVPGTPWRTGVLSESMGDSAFNDPDFQAVRPPKYQALRTQRWLYVEYVNGTRELFDRQASAAEIDNVIASTPPEVVTDLSSHLHALSTCAGSTCREADTWPTGSPAG